MGTSLKASSLQRSCTDHRSARGWSGAWTAGLRERIGGSVHGGGSCRGAGAPRRRARGGAGPAWPRATRPASSGAPGTVSPEDAACEPKAETSPGFRLCLPSPRTGQGLQTKVPARGGMRAALSATPAARGGLLMEPHSPTGSPSPRGRVQTPALDERLCRGGGRGQIRRPAGLVGASTWSQRTPRSLWGMPSRLQPTWPERNVGLELLDLPIFQKKPKTWTTVRTVPTLSVDNQFRKRVYTARPKQNRFTGQSRPAAPRGGSPEGAGGRAANAHFFGR